MPNSQVQNLQIVVAVVGPLCVLAGVLVGAVVQSWLKSRDHREERLKVLREKAEKIFEETELLLEKYTDEVIARLEIVHGIHKNFPRVTSISRLKTLLRLYFPESEEIVKRYEQLYNSVAAEARIAQSSLPNLQASQREAHIYRASHASAVRSSEVGFAFVEEVRKFMDGQAKNLF